MDKKNFHTRQATNKGLVSESRSKVSDVTSKQLPRNGRRRENPNLSNSKADIQRNSKPAPARTRTNVDKRPRPRGGACSLPINISSSGTGLAEQEAGSPDSEADSLKVEFNSVYSPGSKKQNLNHLLNFHYVPRENDNPTFAGFMTRTGNNRGIRKIRYNKEQFLQANCQFVVKSTTDLSVNIISPDALVDWENIEQINIQTTEEPQCPICLYPPVAAKLTRCGHVYCWPCVLHYLALSDKKWRKCPICYEAIHLGDLKSTKILQQTNFKTGECLTFQLMCRKQGSLFIEKVGENQWAGYTPHLNDSAEQKSFSKFLRADPIEILSIIEREKLELAVDDESTPEFIFIEQALTLLKERELTVLKEIKKCNSEVSSGLEISNDDISNIRNKIVPKDGDVSSEQNNTNGEESEQVQMQIMSDDTRISNGNIPVLSSEGTKYYYFYQSADGQNIYLHSLNVRMLQTMYGSLENSPQVLKGKIIQKENYSMTEDFRKRLRYLQHLPLTCQFEVVEVNLEPPVISSDVLEKFRDEIIFRQKNRMKRAREEKKRERQINEMNDRQMGKLMSKLANINIMSPQEFPSCGFDDFLYGNSLSGPPLTPSATTTESAIPIQQQKDNGPSFAKMLSSPKKVAWPSKSSPQATTSAWVKSDPVRLNDRESDTETYDVNAEGVHIVKHSLGDVLAEALEQKKKNITKDISHNSNTESNGKKGRKNKKMLLFSTGMTFNGN